MQGDAADPVRTPLEKTEEKWGRSHEPEEFIFPQMNYSPGKKKKNNQGGRKL